MRKLFYVVGLGVLITFSACQVNDKITDQELDKKAWKEDVNGCTGVRKGLMDDFYNVKDKFIGVDEKGVANLLGKPDRIELTKRHKRFFVYFIEKGRQCEGEETTQEGKAIHFRFNALNMVDEVTTRYASPLK